MIALPANGEIGQPVVLGFAAAGADGDVPAGGARHLAGAHGLAQAADLVDLEQQRVGGLGVDSALDALRVGAQKVISQCQCAGAQRLAQRRPVRPIVLGQAILHTDDRIVAHPAINLGDHALAVEGLIDQLI